MGLLVRERPPVRLSIEASPTADLSPGYRWGADDRNVQNVPNGMTFSTSMPGGFDQGSVTLERDPRLAWPDLQEFTTVTMYGLGGSQVAWQGRLEESPSQAGSEANFTATLVGWQAALQDNADAAMVYIDRILNNWQQPSTQRQLDLLAAGYGLSQWSAAAGADPDGTGAPSLVVTAVEPILGMQANEQWYDAGASKIAAIRALLITMPAIGWPPTGSSLNTVLSSDSVGTTQESEGWNANDGSITFEPSTPYRFAVLQITNNSGDWGTDGATALIAWENVSVLGDHGLTVRAGASGLIPGADDGFLASDVIAHAVSNWAPEIGFTTGSTGTIQPSSFVIPQLTFSPTTPLAIIQQATEYELLDYAVWEGRSLYVNARGARGNQWVSRVGDAQLQNAGPQMSRIFNGVVVQWTDVTGVTYTVGPPGSQANFTSSDLVDNDPLNPANLAGVTKWYLLQAGTTTLAGATQIGQLYLQEQAIANTSGQASIVGHVQDTAGNYWPAWMIRAGDTISFLDASDSSFRRIVSTSYDDTTATNALQLDSPPDGISALLDRLSVSIAASGLQ